MKSAGSNAAPEDGSGGAAATTGAARRYPSESADVNTINASRDGAGPQ